MKGNSIKFIKKSVSLKAQRKKVKVLMVSSILIILVFIAAFIVNLSHQDGSFYNNGGGSDIIAYIDGIGISKAEYQLIINKYRALVLNKYTTDQINSPDFWVTEFDGNTPLSIIQELALEDLKEKKVLQKMAIDRNICNAFSYTSLLQDMSKENDSRSKAVSSGEVIYGNVSFDAMRYYDYIFSNLKNELTDYIIQSNEISITEQELMRYYTENKEEFFIDVWVKVITAEAAYGIEGQKSKEEIIKTFEAVKERMKAGDDLDTLAEEFEGIIFQGLYMDSKNTLSGRMNDYLYRWELASSLMAGEISQPYDTGHSIIMIQCLERKESFYASFEENRDFIRSILLNDRIQKLFKDSILNAKLDLNLEAMDQAALEILGGL